MYDESNKVRRVGERLCRMPCVRAGVQERWLEEAYARYGTRGREMVESILKGANFKPGYPKRIIIGKTEPQAQAWQDWFDFCYEAICDIYGIEPKPKQIILF